MQPRVDAALFSEQAERDAARGSIANGAAKADALFDTRRLPASLRELAALKAPVDAFFDQVMVNADDPALRANRLALLVEPARSR